MDDALAYLLLAQQMTLALGYGRSEHKTITDAMERSLTRSVDRVSELI